MEANCGKIVTHCELHGELLMAPTLEALGIDQMSVAARIELVTAIWDSIGAEPHPPLITETQQRELDHRLAELAGQPDAVVPWEIVQAEALARFRK